jgi:hypothetical protein
MSIVLNGTTGITTPDVTSDGSLKIDASAPDDSLVVDASGNVGIGTSSPSNTLEVKSPTNDNGIRLSNSAGSYYHLVRSNGDGLLFDADAGNTGGSGADIRFQIKGGEKARINSAGDLLVGTTSTINAGKISVSFAGATQNGITLQTTLPSTGSDFMQFFNSAGSVAGKITQNGTTTIAYTTSSDYRLKNTIAPMTGALDKVALLKPCTYKWNVDGSDGEGFIAHELQAVVPQCVTGEKDAVGAEGNPVYQGIDTSFLVATLTAAIQEQQAIIDEQKTALEALTARVSALEAV